MQLKDKRPSPEANYCLKIFTMCVKKAGTCKYGNEFLGSIKCGEFLD